MCKRKIENDKIGNKKAGEGDIYLNNKSNKMVAYRMLFDLAKKTEAGCACCGN